MNDKERIAAIRENKEALRAVYQECRSRAMAFLLTYFGDNLDDADRLSIYHDALLVFYEKIIHPDFELKASIQTYINSVCRNMGYEKLREKGKLRNFNSKISEEQLADFNVDVGIEDSLEKEEKMSALENALEKAFDSLKQAGGHCYNLLHDFWYHNLSIQQLTEKYNYANTNTAKQQKAKCQKRLKNLAQQFLNISYD
jgi:RNA polymerase sigma factor (sigma-70 family)